MAEVRRFTCRRVVPVPPCSFLHSPYPQVHSPAPHRSEVPRHRPVNTDPTQMLTAGPGAHMLSLAFTIPHRHSWCTQTINLQTCLHVLAHVVIHPHAQAPPKTTQGRGYHPHALLLTKLASWDLLNCCQGEEPAAAKDACQHVGGCPPAPCCLVTKPKPGLRNAGQRREKEKCSHPII